MGSRPTDPHETRVVASPEQSGLRQIIVSLELFVGLAEVTKASRRRRRVAVAFDINIDPVGNDFLGAVGYLCAVALSLKLKAIAQANAAPVCSSWGWMNRGASGTGERTHWVVTYWCPQLLQET